MIKIGRFNQLKVVKHVDFGVYLDGENLGEILLPRKVTPPNIQLDDIITVFLYFDSEDRIIATTAKPDAQLGECAFLKVVDINPVGAFLDWGLDKDLLVPKSEQLRPMEKNKSYLVYLKQDHEGRIFASTKLDYFLDKEPFRLKPFAKVNLLIADTTDLGRKVIINHKYWGLIYSNDIFQHVTYGQKTTGYIKAIRPDGKIDVTLRQTGQNQIHHLANQILKALHQADGFLPLHDKSPASDIQRVFNESKKSFKSAVGYLYKQQKITIEADGIRLKPSDNNTP